jgi:uncharacterized protein
MLKDHLLGMFAAIDGRAFDDLERYFTHDVVYERPGYEPIRGIADLLRFYREERRIESGQHDVESLVCGDDAAVAMGTFQGVLKDGAPATEPFADAYRFQNGRIAHRKTYFFRPAI